MIRIGVAGLIAYKAAFLLALKNEEELKKTFSSRFLHSFDSLQEQMPETHAENEEEKESGGFFGTIWQALDRLEECSKDSPEKNADGIKMPFPVQPPIGCRVDLRQVPVRQEIIEICELFDEDPYEADSGGAYLVIWEEDPQYEGKAENALWFPMSEPGTMLTKQPEWPEGASVVPVGYITCSKDRLIINGDMVRYLTPFRRQMADICARKNDRRSKDGKKR